MSPDRPTSAAASNARNDEFVQRPKADADVCHNRVAASRFRFKRERWHLAPNTWGVTLSFGGKWHLLRAWLYLGKWYGCLEVRR